MQEVNLEFNILGLRDLRSTGLFPVRKAFIKFDFNSCVFPGEDITENKNIMTQPKEVGSNPNFHTIIKFSAMMPVEPLF